MAAPVRATALRSAKVFGPSTRYWAAAAGSAAAGSGFALRPGLAGDHEQRGQHGDEQDECPA